MKYKDILTPLEDDGLVTPLIGLWGERKYRLVVTYASIFAKAMKHHWDTRVYIDLFSGPGRSRIEGTDRIVPASPLLALNISHKFDLYIFCEQDPERISALKQRVDRNHSDTDVKYVEGDANLLTNKILEILPAYGKSKRVLTFCFADPYNLKNLRFHTIRVLAKRLMDFLVLIPTGMDATRNWDLVYTKSDNKVVDDFLGTSVWREAWQEAKAKRQSVDIFLTDFYGEQMRKLKYIYSGSHTTELIRLPDKNVPLYRLAFFSRHDLGERFWKDVKKYCTPQLEFEDLS